MAAHAQRANNQCRKKEAVLISAVKTQQGLIARFSATVLLLAFALVAVFSAAHQTEFELNASGLAHELTQLAADNAEPSTDAQTVAGVVCAASFLCHAPQLLFFDTPDTGRLHTLSDIIRPDPGALPRSLTIDVATPPPLNARA